VTADQLARETVGDRNFDAVFTEGKRCLHLGWKPAARLSIGSAFAFILNRFFAHAGNTINKRQKCPEIMGAY
jgi:hypothetical protein